MVAFWTAFMADTVPLTFEGALVWFLSFCWVFPVFPLLLFPMVALCAIGWACAWND